MIFKGICGQKILKYYVQLSPERINSKIQAEGLFSYLEGFTVHDFWYTIHNLLYSIQDVRYNIHDIMDTYDLNYYPK